MASIKKKLSKAAKKLGHEGGIASLKGKKGIFSPAYKKAQKKKSAAKNPAKPKAKAAKKKSPAKKKKK